MCFVSTAQHCIVLTGVTEDGTLVAVACAHFGVTHDDSSLKTLSQLPQACGAVLLTLCSHSCLSDTDRPRGNTSEQRQRDGTSLR